MQTLWFIKLENKVGSAVVFCQTAETASDAGKLAVMGISEFCRADFRLIEVTAICTTPDTVELFQPC